MANQGEIILYQPDSEVKLEVRLEEETVWLTQAQIVELFHSSKANISEHIKNIYEQEELDESATVRDFRTVRQEEPRPFPDYRRDGRLSHRCLAERPWQEDVRLLQIRDTGDSHHCPAVRHNKQSPLFRLLFAKRPQEAGGFLFPVCQDNI